MTVEANTLAVVNAASESPWMADATSPSTRAWISSTPQRHSARAAMRYARSSSPTGTLRRARARAKATARGGGAGGEGAGRGGGVAAGERRAAADDVADDAEVGRGARARRREQLGVVAQDLELGAQRVDGDVGQHLPAEATSPLDERAPP